MCYVRQPKESWSKGDQASFYKHLKGLDVEHKTSFTCQTTKDGDGKVLRDAALFRERWGWWFHTLLNTKSP